MFSVKLDAFCQKGGEKPSESTLFLVSTPIGHLADVSLRALDTLNKVALIACEDTRRTRKLLSRFDIHTRTLSCHEHNESERLPRLLGLLRQGKNIALVSDAGAPCICDPGARLVAAALSEGFAVVSVPGPSAVICALQISGLPAVPFSFHGFLPARQNARKKSLEALKTRPETMVFFEAPHRVLKTLKTMRDVFGDRLASLSREISKIHEETLRTPLSHIYNTLQARPSLKGEMTLVVAGASEKEASEKPPYPDPASHARALLETGMPKKEALKVAAKAWKLPKRELYRRMLKKPRKT